MIMEDPNDISGLDDLYQEMILDHYKRPQNFGSLDPVGRKAVGHNPLCGDRLSVEVRLTGERIDDIRFRGQGCAISTASASLMTEAVKGKNRAEANTLYGRFHQMVTGEDDADDEVLGKLTALGGVSAFPVRVKCATLAWHTLRAAMEGTQTTVSTED